MAHSTPLAGASASPVTKALCGAVTALSLLGFYLRNSRLSEKDAEDKPDVLPVIAVVPGSSLWYFWTFVTANFLETNVFSLVVSVVTLLLCGKYLERVWGSRELLIFCTVSGTVPMFAAFLFFVFAYVGSTNEDYLYAVQANGMTAVLCGFSVAFKHLVPEHTVKLFAGAVSVRVKYLPFAFLALQLVLAVLTGLLPQAVLAVSGLMTSWVYIRFFRMQDGTHGDRSETFSFASFFPELIQPPVKVLSNITFKVLVSLRICNPMPTTAGAPFDLEGGISMRPNVRQVYAPQAPPSVGHGGVSSGDQANADRRRALALKQLDMRLTSHQQQQQQQQPAPPLLDSAIRPPSRSNSPAPKQPTPQRAASPSPARSSLSIKPQGQLAPNGETSQPGEGPGPVGSFAGRRSPSPAVRTGEAGAAAAKATADKVRTRTADSGPRPYGGGGAGSPVKGK